MPILPEVDKESFAVFSLPLHFQWVLNLLLLPAVCEQNVWSKVELLHTKDYFVEGALLLGQHSRAFGVYLLAYDAYLAQKPAVEALCL